VRASRYLIALVIVLAPPTDSFADSGRDAWLRYRPLPAAALSSLRVSLPGMIVQAGDGDVLRSAAGELALGVGGFTGHTPVIVTTAQRGGAIYVGTLDRVRTLVPAASLPATLDAEGFWLSLTRGSGGTSSLVVAGGSERGALFGVFALLREIAQGHDLSSLNRIEAPSAPLRWTDEWDNMDGSIERGYGGRSIFFRDNHVLPDLTLAGQYARLLASVGINACAVSSVNANPLVITDPFLPELARLAAAFRPWGVRIAVSIDFSSPKLVGGLDTFDPLDPKVAAFWKGRADAIYRAVPDLAGFVLKADSEGRLGPSAYGRTHADAANAIARALAPHHGVIFYRGFVYDHHMDWRNPRNDRARAAWDNFHDLDGKFDDNVVLQIKHGPIDFQAREPVSPLFGALKATNQSIELQITQEYTGQQRHVCFLVPMWKEALDFDLQADGSTPVSALVTGRHFRRPAGGFVGVSNVGDSSTWLGADLAMANLYGFGRLAWNPSLSAERIADEWTRQTFGNDPRVVETTNGILLGSWPAYEHYTGPLGTQTLTDITGPHYGPGIESSENNGWGQWHRADAQGIGMDRTVATGTGYAGQYSPAVAAIYESLKTCPDDLLLFMHHVPYTYVLHSGKTVIQHFYDSHYQGVDEVAGFLVRWRRLKGFVDDERYERIVAALEYQEGHAIVWRDAINGYFLKLSGIADENGRAGHFPGRYEAETMTLEGYAPIDVTPWETAGGGKAVTCAGAGPCRASFTFDGASGRYDVRVRYFDLNTGESTFTLAVRRAGLQPRQLEIWKADDRFPTKEPNGHSSTWHVTHAVELSHGDTIVVEGTPDGAEPAPLDYVEIVPVS
jgi:alpha-glucuronidase